MENNEVFIDKADRKNYFQTIDLFMVAYLILKGFTLARPPTLNAKKILMVYTFPRTPELNQAMAELLNGTALVEPLSLLEKYKTLRSRTWEAKHQDEEIGGGSDE